MCKCEESNSFCADGLSDEELCVRVARGNRGAEERLVSKYTRLVRSCARPFFLIGGDSEDLLQEGMIGLMKAVREYDGERDASFRTFAETCVRNRLLSVLRAASRGKHMPLIDREHTSSLLFGVRKQLSEFEAKILGYYLDGLSCREIAETVGKSPKSVDNAVQRIRRKVARQLLSGDFSKS